MSATRPRELIPDGPEGLPRYTMPCHCDEFSGDIAASQFTDRSRFLVEPDFNERHNPAFASGLSEK